MWTSNKSLISPMKTPKKTDVDPDLEAECKTMKMSPPAKEGVYLSLGTIMLAIEKDGFENKLHDERKRKALIYLYGRDFWGGIGFETRRKTEIAAILSNAQLLLRLENVLQNSADTDVGYLDEYFFGNWTNLAEEWAMQDGAYTVFEASHIGIVLRKQLSKNCFLHAPAVLHGYLVQRSTKEFHGMVDITKFVRHYFCDESFSRLVVHDDGGDSQDMLDSLIGGPPMITFNPKDAEYIQDIIENLKEFGPALVRCFAIDENMASFATTTGENDDFEHIPFFEDYVKRSEKQLHAMVLVGYRDNDSGDGFNFLLQNWWPSMQFLEVSDKFLIASKALTVFVTKPVKKTDELPLNMYRVAEAHVLEGQDWGGWGSEGFLNGRERSAETHL